MKELSNNIRALRKSLNLTQEELANKLNRAGSTIRMWELDKASPDAETLLDLSKIFGVSLDVLLGNIELTSTNANTETTSRDKEIDKIKKDLSSLNQKQLKLVKNLVSEISYANKK